MSGLLRCNSAMAEGGVRLFLLLESAPFRRRSTDGTNFITGGRPQVIFHVNIRMVTERVSFGFPCCQQASKSGVAPPGKQNQPAPGEVETPPAG